METIKSILEYFFTKIPGTEFAYYTYSYVLIATLFIASLVFGHIYNKKKKEDLAFKRLFKKVSSRLMMFSILFGILILLRYEQIPFLSTRILLYITGISFTYWLFKTGKTYKNKYTKEQKNQEAKKHSIKEKKKVKTYSASKKKRQ